MDYSREYLQGLPLEKKRADADRIIGIFIKDLLRDASNGWSSYLYNTNHVIIMKGAPAMTAAQEAAYAATDHRIPEISVEDLIPLFKERFPGCKVTYVDRLEIQGVFKKGILIDWS